MKLHTKDMILVALFAALTAVGAFIKIPIPYVPFTLQFFFCAMAGILLGAKLGMLSQILYVTMGLIGMPVFTQGGGPGYILQPTFGYLLGFIFGAFVIGKVLEHIRVINFWKMLIAILSGLFFVYFFGVSYLYLICNLYLDEAKTVWWALYWGFLICVGGDLVLSVITALISQKALNTLVKANLIQDRWVFKIAKENSKNCKKSI